MTTRGLIVADKGIVHTKKDKVQIGEGTMQNMRLLTGVSL